MEHTGLEKFEREFRLWQEKIPAIGQVVWGHTGKDGEEVVLEHADGLLCCIVAVDVWRDQLVAAFVCCDSMLEGDASFIVEDVHGGCAVGCDMVIVDVMYAAMQCMSCLEGKGHTRWHWWHCGGQP